MGKTWTCPPPAAPPLIPKTGPIDGSLITHAAFFPIRFKPMLKPIVVTVFPSPYLVGFTLVTSTNDPLGRSSLERIAGHVILAMCLPNGISSSTPIPIFHAISSIGASSIERAMSKSDSILTRLLFVDLNLERHPHRFSLFGGYMGGRRSVHCIVAGSPISHSLTPLLSLLVDRHLNSNENRQITAISRHETKDMSSLLGQIVLGKDLGAKEPKNNLLTLVENATTEILKHPDGWGISSMSIGEIEVAETPFGDNPLVWVSITTPLKHGLTARSGVISTGRSLEIASTNQIRWDGHRLVTGSTDGLGVVLVARSFGLFSGSTPPLLILRGGGAAARSVAEAWSDAGGRIYALRGRRPLDMRGPWASSLIHSLKDRGLAPTLYIDFDSNLEMEEDIHAPVQVDLHLTPSYDLSGSVKPIQGAEGTLHLDGRWMLAAQHLLAWAIFIEPGRKDDLPDLSLLLSRLSEVEKNMSD